VRRFLVALGLLCAPAFFALAADKEADTKIATGVQGAVTINIVSGQMRPPGVPTRRPASGEKVRILLAGKDTVVEEAVTDPQGRFRIGLPAGEYRVEILPGGALVAKPALVRVTVKEGEIAEIDTVKLEDRRSAR
jgi:hypothetical protein